MEALKLEDILVKENMDVAWAAVERNDGAAGVDRKTVAATKLHLREHWPGVREKLINDVYKPAAVRAVEIPKASGGVRTLGIPNVQDRLIQQALHQSLSAVFEPRMSEHSYGFRPNRSAHDAVTAARKYVEEGKKWVVDIDLKSFFDQVSHDRLMNLISPSVSDKRVLRLIGRYLRAPMRYADGRQEKRLRGTPQGGPLSPLLANIYLGPLDMELERRAIAFVRYADDVALFLSSERAAQRALENITVWLKKVLDLEVNESKSGSGPSGESQLLGFRIHTSGNVSIAPKAIKRLKERVRQLWDARQSLKTVELRTQWRRFITGWWNYFNHANWQGKVKSLSGWIRRHMRKCFWQRWHNRKGRRNALYRLGVRGRALGVAGTRTGAWPMSINVVVNQALKTKTLNHYGFTLPWELAAK
jgi:RNA-directed DNA polymerase